MRDSMKKQRAKEGGKEGDKEGRTSLKQWDGEKTEEYE